VWVGSPKAPTKDHPAYFKLYHRLLAAIHARALPTSIDAVATAAEEFATEYAPSAALRDAHVVACRRSVAYRDSFLPACYTACTPAAAAAAAAAACE
jgi:hypothetical protein